MRLINREGLKEKGIHFSASHLWRLTNAGKFPRQVKIGEKNAWVESEIDEYIKTRIAVRDEMAAWAMKQKELNPGTGARRICAEKDRRGLALQKRQDRSAVSNIPDVVRPAPKASRHSTQD
jgi:prophage regulatory protein